MTNDISNVPNPQVNETPCQPVPENSAVPLSETKQDAPPVMPQNVPQAQQFFPPPYPYPAVVKKPKRPVQVLDRRDFIFTAVTFMFSIFAYEFALRGGFEAGLAATHILFLILATAYFKKSRKGVGTYALFCGLVSAAFAVTFAVSNGMLFFPCFAAMIFTAVVYVFCLWGQPKYPLGSYTTVFDALRYAVVIPIFYLPEPFRAYLAKGGSKIKKAPKVLIGMVIALPILGVVVPQLINSDAAFEGLMSKIGEDLFDLLGRILLTIIIFIFVFSFLFAVRKGLDKPHTEGRPKGTTHIADSTVVNTTLVLLSLVYVVYMLAQLGYFFSAFSGLLPEDFTVAEYARRGFFEMCFIAFVNLGVMFLSLVLSKIRDGKISPLTKCLCLFIGVFSILLISTAQSKMFLYIGSFGLTTKRVITSAFMVVLFLVFIYTIIRIFNARFPYMKFAVATACVVLLALTFADVDRCVAKYNIYAYHAGITNELDMDLLSGLGSGSTPEIVPLLDEKDDTVWCRSELILLDRAGIYFDISNDMKEYNEYDETKIKSFNLSEYREKEALRGYLERLKNYK